MALHAADVSMAPESERRVVEGVLVMHRAKVQEQKIIADMGILRGDGKRWAYHGSNFTLTGCIDGLDVPNRRVVEVKTFIHGLPDAPRASDLLQLFVYQKIFGEASGLLHEEDELGNVRETYVPWDGQQWAELEREIEVSVLMWDEPAFPCIHKVLPSVT